MFSVMIKAKAIGIAQRNATTTVAVKTVQSNTDPYYLNILASELTIMIHLGRHINVIDLLGVSTTEADKSDYLTRVNISYREITNSQRVYAMTYFRLDDNPRVLSFWKHSQMSVET